MGIGKLVYTADYRLISSTTAFIRLPSGLFLIPWDVSKYTWSFIEYQLADSGPRFSVGQRGSCEL